jgi:hypothetical protein
MESRYGSPERASQYRAIIRKATQALNQESWDPRYRLYADTPAKKSYSQEANILAVWLNVAAPPEQAPIVRRLLASKEGQPTTLDGRAVPPLSVPSYYFRFYLARALDHAGLADEYVHQLAPWYNMLHLGLTTWAETPEPTRSDCHAWSASPNYDLLTLVAGIRPSDPGFRTVRIEPHLRGLHQLDASMPHAGDIIHTVYANESGHWRATITLPAGLTGTLIWKNAAHPLHPGAQTLALP